MAARLPVSMRERLPGVERSVRRAFAKTVQSPRVVAFLNFYGRRIRVIAAEKPPWRDRGRGSLYNVDYDAIVIYREALKAPIPSGLRHVIAHEMAHAASRRKLRRCVPPSGKTAKFRKYARNKFEVEAEMAAICAVDIPFLKSRIPAMMTSLLQTAYPHVKEWRGSDLEKALFKKLKKEFGCR
jgi:hypothetical protein